MLNHIAMEKKMRLRSLVRSQQISKTIEWERHPHGRYKYRLLDDYVYLCADMRLRNPVWHEFITLSRFGVLLIRKNYAWDGASGPAIDRGLMRASLVHDALYQLMREGLLDRSWRKTADQEFRRIIREDGGWWIRAWWCYWAVRVFGARWGL